MAYDLFLLQPDGNKLDQIDVLAYKSAVWEKSWQDIGTAQIVFAHDSDTLEKVTPDKLFVFNNDETLYYIHSVKLTETELWAYAVEAKWLYTKRSIMEELPSGDVDVRTEVGRVLNAYADIPYVDGFFIGRETKNLAGLGFMSAWELIQNVQRMCDFGTRMEYNATTHTAELWIMSGTDATATDRYSRFDGNLAEYDITRSNKSYCNTVYAIGTDGVVETAVDGTPAVEFSAILDLRETYPRDPNMSLADYRAAVANRANMSLIARHETEKLENIKIRGGELEVHLNNGVGRLVTVAINEYGAAKPCRVTKVTTTAEGNTISRLYELKAENS